MTEIIIGKHTLESLTSGMYTDPLVLYREYIQNASDSIDSAFNLGILSTGEERIEISLNPLERQIIIFDNGVGIESDKAERTLISIGNSKKDSSQNRGFRGIGRLSALSYCNRLTFETSCFGEHIGTRVSIDASSLSDLLSIKESDDITMIDVLRSVYTIEKYQELSNYHYFKVKLDGVDVSSTVLDYDRVYDYISQNAPVPYHGTLFTWGNEIERRVLREGFRINHYNIMLTFGGKTIPVFKPYKDKFLVDKGKNIFDNIRDIDIIKIEYEGRISAIGWIAKTGYRGSIYDKTVKGIRLRKGNILIGDAQTLNSVFKDSRFNGWSIGEIFAVDVNLIPNARRDNFEKNQSYFSLMEQMIKHASIISKEIRFASMKRNSELSVALRASEDTKNIVDSALTDRTITNTKKEKLKRGIEETKLRISQVAVHENADEYYKNIAFEELDILTGRLSGATRYRALNMISSLSNTEKRVLEKVFDIIDLNLGESAELIINTILENFTSKS